MLQALLIRHASAGLPSDWAGEDALRPLDGLGRVQAAGLPEDLAAFPLLRILSSPAVRCVETVAPLALNRGLVVERRPELAEGSNPADVVALIRGVGGSAALCTHGDVLYELTGTEPPKGGTLVVALGEDLLQVVELVAPRDVV